jgi:hypothetical protein
VTEDFSYQIFVKRAGQSSPSLLKIQHPNKKPYIPIFQNYTELPVFNDHRQKKY